MALGFLEPALVIATLDAFAALVALKLQFGERPRGCQTKVKIAPTITDNRGNGAPLKKLMTTTFPASAALLELAAYMKKMGLWTVEWAPREGNRESDKLVCGRYFRRRWRWDVLRRRTTRRRRTDQDFLIVPGSKRGVGQKSAYALQTHGEWKIDTYFLSGLLVSSSFQLIPLLSRSSFLSSFFISTPSDVCAVYVWYFWLRRFWGLFCVRDSEFPAFLCFFVGLGFLFRTALSLSDFPDCIRHQIPRQLFTAHRPPDEVFEACQ